MAKILVDWSQCTCRCMVLPDLQGVAAYCALIVMSQCTYRCVVLPDSRSSTSRRARDGVSMHLQVRGAP